MQVTEQCTLIIPVAIDVPPSDLSLGAITLHAKQEHHLTVFGFTVGKLLARAFEADPGLRERINDLAASFDWSVTLLPRCYHLTRPRPEGGTLQTVMVMVNAKTDLFFHEVRRMIAPPSTASQAVPELDALLAEPPSAHITLFTTDPDGLAGIGVQNRRELDEALQRANGGDTTGLGAYLLGPGVVPMPAR